MSALFIPYGKLPRDYELTNVRVVGTNMSNPPWADLLPSGIKLITTVDVPRSKMVAVTPTVEHAWGLILAAHRRLPLAAADAYGDRNKHLAPYQLAGRSLGIVGFGRIGEGVARVAYALGMYVHTVDKHTTRLIRSLLINSDIVLVSCTLTEKTRNLLNAERLALMKPDAILVSIAPWVIVDISALLKQLSERKLRAAAFDDWPSMRWPPTDELREEGKLIITPHIGGSTLDAREMTQRFVEEEMYKWLKENPA